MIHYDDTWVLLIRERSLKISADGCLSRGSPLPSFSLLLLAEDSFIRIPALAVGMHETVSSQTSSSVLSLATFRFDIKLTFADLGSKQASFGDWAGIWVSSRGED